VIRKVTIHITLWTRCASKRFITAVTRRLTRRHVTTAFTTQEFVRSMKHIMQHVVIPHQNLVISDIEGFKVHKGFVKSPPHTSGVGFVATYVHTGLSGE
jgi:hypothetical protein